MNHLYDFYIFDADHTLFEFDAFEGLKHMFANFDVQFDLEDYEFYQQTNKPLWVQYQNGEISADTLKQCDSAIGVKSSIYSLKS